MGSGGAVSKAGPGGGTPARSAAASPWRCSRSVLPRLPGLGPPRPRRRRTRRTWRPPSWAYLRLLTLDPASTREAPPLTGPDPSVSVPEAARVCALAGLNLDLFGLCICRLSSSFTGCSWACLCAVLPLSLSSWPVPELVCACSFDLCTCIRVHVCVCCLCHPVVRLE